MKNSVAKNFLRTPVAGFRYSRGTDTTPPSMPQLSAPVSLLNALAIQWINGFDAESGIRETWAEVSPTGLNTWSRTVVPYAAGAGISIVFSGLAGSQPFDVRIQNINGAGLQSGYTGIQTATTLGSNPALEPGTVSFGQGAISSTSGQPFSVAVQRTGAGDSCPAMTATWQIAFPQGAILTVPGNGTISWQAGESGTKFIQATTVSGVSTTVGTLALVSASAATGSIQPTIGAPSMITFTVFASSVTGKKWDPGHYMASNNLTFADDRKRGEQLAEQNLVLSSGVNVKGWEGYYYAASIWNSSTHALDPTFPLRDLQYLEQMNPRKYLKLTIYTQLYNSTKYADAIPADIYNNAAMGAAPAAYPSKYGFWTINGGSGITPALWRAPVMDFYIAMFQALAATTDTVTGLPLDQVPALIRTSFGETGFSIDAGSDFGDGSALITQYQRLIDAIEAAWPNTIHDVQNNFTVTQTQAQTLTNYTPTKAQAQSGPDIQPVQSSNNGLSWGQRAVLGVAQPTPQDTHFLGSDQRGYIDMSSEVQSPELVGGGNNSAYTPSAIFQVGNDTLHQSHMWWCCTNRTAQNDPIPAYPGTGKNTSANPGNWHQVMQVINGNPVTHIAKPTSIP